MTASDSTALAVGPAAKGAGIASAPSSVVLSTHTASKGGKPLHDKEFAGAHPDTELF